MSITTSIDWLLHNAKADWLVVARGLKVMNKGFKKQFVQWYAGAGKIRVNVYKNLHKNLFSVRGKGIVFRHLDKIVLRDVRFLVQEKGRDKVRATKQKNVHAFVSGYIISEIPKSGLDILGPVWYNPYVVDSFVLGDKRNHSPIFSCDFVEMDITNGLSAFRITR